MNHKYRFSNSYVYFPIPLFLLILLVEYLTPSAAKDVLPTVSIAVITFLLFRFGSHCFITDKKFVRVSYFFFKKTITIDDILEIDFPSSWIVTPQARTLVVRDNTKRTITMTDMAYGRSALADVVRTLLDANPHIKINKDVEKLLKNA
jgi:hypothetical protein